MKVDLKKLIGEMPPEPVKRDVLFFNIIAYLNDHDMQSDSRIWKTSEGHVWIYVGKHGWEQHWMEVSNWPVT